MKPESYKSLNVWKMAVDLAITVYSLTIRFPRAEMYGMVSQMRRAAVSIPSNIAEGSRRWSRKEYHHFVMIAYGSGAELETLFNISRRLKFCPEAECTEAERLLNQIMRMLNRLASALR